MLLLAELHTLTLAARSCLILWGKTGMATPVFSLCLFHLYFSGEFGSFSLGNVWSSFTVRTVGWMQGWKVTSFLPRGYIWSLVVCWVQAKQSHQRKIIGYEALQVDVPFKTLSRETYGWWVGGNPSNVDSWLPSDTIATHSFVNAGFHNGSCVLNVHKQTM